MLKMALSCNVNPVVHIIACGVLSADISHLIERLGLAASVEYLPGGLHADPEVLRRRLQECIDRASATFRGERIVLGYGVCGRGTVGLRARNIPLAIPRVNDCIALFLGSDAAYREQFARYPGTYYVSAGWVEGKSQPQAESESPIQCGPERFTFSQLIERYGQENAEAIRHFLSTWQQNYQRAAFIDTGISAGHRKYAELAEAMAREFGWKYEPIRGSHDLLVELITADRTTSQVLLVPPHHTTAHDPVGKTLVAVPVWQPSEASPRNQRTLVFGTESVGSRVHYARTGLGIDAGGTYTDVVLYDFEQDSVVAKAKSLTTKWDFSIGIGEALDRMPRDRIAGVDLVSISTTLATNAIVENRGQKVGLLIFPPYGLFAPEDIAYRPLGVLRGQLEIDGRELLPVDTADVRQQARAMVRNEQVDAFAVSGYASHVNPTHELQAKAAIVAETGLHVTCAHEVSEKRNYRIRSVTAALNASIIPCLDALLRDIDAVLLRRGITAARMVVRSDGTLMGLAVARRCPIETVLSGPAASVAGASHLAGLSNAMVVDMGGTTTDTAMVRNGVVRTCREGALVGGWRTHVGALDLRTLGLGGDSRIARGRNGDLVIGPQRVAPIAWALRNGDGGQEALDWLDDHWSRFRSSTEGMELVVSTSDKNREGLTAEEQHLLDVLATGPCSLAQLAVKLGARRWEFLPLESLERHNRIVRSSLTPTDLLHADGRMALWNASAARRFCGFFCRLFHLSQEEFARQIHRRIVHRLATELLKKQLAETTDADELDQSKTSRALLENWLCGGSDDYRVRLALKYRLVGIGAPVHLYLPEVARLLETEAVIPPHADVANAIGAITSRIVIQKTVEIAPSENGRYAVAGLADTPTFSELHDAEHHAIEELLRQVRGQAFEAGTSETRVEIHFRDSVAPASDGSMIFLGRTLTARLSGRPSVDG